MNKLSFRMNNSSEMALVPRFRTSIVEAIAMPELTKSLQAM